MVTDNVDEDEDVSTLVCEVVTTNGVGGLVWLVDSVATLGASVDED